MKQTQVSAREEDYGLSKKAIAAIVGIPAIAIIVGVWFVLHITAEPTPKQPSPPPASSSPVPVIAKPVVVPAVTRPIVQAPPQPDPRDLELKRLREENARLQDQIRTSELAAAAEAERVRQKEAQRAAAEQQNTPEAKLARFNEFAKRYAAAVTKRSQETFDNGPSIAGEKFTWETHYSLKSTDIQSSPSLVHPTVFIAVLSGSIVGKSGDYMSLDIHDITVTLAESGAGRKVVKALEKVSQKSDTYHTGNENTHVGEEHDLTGVPWLVKAAEDASN